MSTATVTEIVNAAAARSVANDPGILWTSTEILGVTRRILRHYYARAAEIDPVFFAESVAVAPSTGWARPATPDVLRVEDTTGAEVHIVPLNDRFRAEFPPRIYRLGNLYRSVGETGDPDEDAGGDTLTFFVAGKVDDADLDETTDTLPAAWPAEHDDLVIVELAIYLSLKDKARGDLAALEDEKAKLIALFDASIEASDSALKTRFSGISGQTKAAS